MEKVILVGCQFPNLNDEQFTYSMEELQALTTTAGGEVVAIITQKREKKDSATYIGKGKLEELKQLEEALSADLVIFNDELTPSQQNRLAQQLEGRLIDRTQLILDIFAGRAHSKEGQLQVELAQLQYMLPRLSGIGVSLSRLGAGIGTRGPGETKLETDRRYIRRRITDIKKQLDVIVSHRDRYRERRKKNAQFQIALVGYTNAGKSTLFNRFTQAETLEENKLFATLDPLTRRYRFPSGFTALLTDTVGFIQHLPTALIAAFRSTLEEVKEADLFIHVIDASNPDYLQHEQTVLSLLESLDADQIPMLTIYNKKDLLESDFIKPTVKDSLLVSVYDKKDVESIEQAIEGKVEEQLEKYKIYIGAEKGSLMAQLERESVVTHKLWYDEKACYLYEGYIRPNTPLQAEIQQLKE